MIKIINIINELKAGPRGIKKLKNKAIKDNNIDPKIIYEKRFLLVSFGSKIEPAQ